MHELNLKTQTAAPKRENLAMGRLLTINSQQKGQGGWTSKSGMQMKIKTTGPKGTDMEELDRTQRVFEHTIQLTNIREDGVGAVFIEKATLGSLSFDISGEGGQARKLSRQDPMQGTEMQEVDDADEENEENEDDADDAMEAEESEDLNGWSGKPGKKRGRPRKRGRPKGSGKKESGTGQEDLLEKLQSQEHIIGELAGRLQKLQIAASTIMANPQGLQPVQASPQAQVVTGNPGLAHQELAEKARRLGVSPTLMAIMQNAEKANEALILEGLQHARANPAQGGMGSNMTKTLERLAEGLDRMQDEPGKIHPVEFLISPKPQAATVSLKPAGQPMLKLNSGFPAIILQAPPHVQERYLQILAEKQLEMMHPKKSLPVGQQPLPKPPARLPVPPAQSRLAQQPIAQPSPVQPVAAKAALALPAPRPTPKPAQPLPGRTVAMQKVIHKNQRQVAQRKAEPHVRIGIGEHFIIAIWTLTILLWIFGYKAVLDSYHANTLMVNMVNLTTTYLTLHAALYMSLHGIKWLFGRLGR